MKLSSIAALMAALGLDIAIRQGGALAATTIGCYPRYSSSATYTPGAMISYTRSVTTTESCSGNTGGCIDGSKEVTANVHENYECTSDVWCSNSGYAPGTVYEGQAWTRRQVCDPSEPTPDPIVPDEWDLSGCPAAYVAGADYYEGDAVSVQLGSFKMVYTCAAHPNSLFCGKANFDPGTSLYWKEAWIAQGSCTGSLAPTGSPAFDILSDQGGCPDEYSSGSEYDETDKVSVNGFVYQCKAYPEGEFCKQAGYEPGNTDNDNWKMAWDLLGYCEGTVNPTSSPAFDNYEDLGVCPDEWEARAFPLGNEEDAYQEGDKISVNGIVFQCRAWPLSGHCGQAGYVPFNEDASTPDAWKDAWTVSGYCNYISVGPTISPTFDLDGNIGGCPDEWISGGGEDGYSEGDMVSVTISMDPERKVAYRCKAWPYDGHCGQYSPTEFGGDLGWQYAGSCDGSLGPTMSPVFESLNEIGDGCPAEHDSSVDYEAGDQVAVVISDATDNALPERTLVYECNNDVHTSKFCANQVSIYSPGEAFGYLGWHLKGFCSGTVSPTPSPTQYKGDCFYTKCETSSCMETRVEGYRRGTTYEAGDVVHVAGQRFKCKPHPATGWCNIDTYEPQLEVNEYWPKAWTRDGRCPEGGTSSPTNPPTSSPTDSPTKKPTSSPTDSPTKKPTASPTGSPTKKPTSSPTDSPTKKPTASPTMSSISMRNEQSIQVIGQGFCQDGGGNYYDYVQFNSFTGTPQDCYELCIQTPEFLRSGVGFNINSSIDRCQCRFEDGLSLSQVPANAVSTYWGHPGTGPIAGADNDSAVTCYAVLVPPLVTHSEGNPISEYPMGLCEGDCDQDTHCEGDLVCFERSGTEAVPGCDGLGLSQYDYCVQPSLISIAGTPDTYPLGLCEGDCDNDDHCQGGLVCFERSGTEAVPGCDGQGVNGWDYCYKPYVDCDGGFVRGSNPQVTCETECDGDCCVGLNSCTDFTGLVWKDGSCSGQEACWEATIPEVKNSCKAWGSQGGYRPCIRAGYNGGSVGKMTDSCWGKLACQSLGSSGGQVGYLTNSCHSVDNPNDSSPPSGVRLGVCYGVGAGGGSVGDLTNSCFGYHTCRGLGYQGVVGPISNSCGSPSSVATLDMGHGNCYAVGDYHNGHITAIKDCCDTGTDRDQCNSAHDDAALIGMDSTCADPFDQLAPSETMINYNRRNVGIHGSTAVVGALRNNNSRGAAFVFAKNDNGGWEQQAKLVHPNPSDNDYFGIDAKIFGDTIVIGASGDDSGKGSAHVFVRTGSTWTRQATIVASDRANSDGFGGSVGIHENTIIVGARRDDNNKGAAYVFVRNGSTWSQQKKLTASDRADGDYYGQSVAIHDNTAIVGAYGDNGSYDYTGSAYVYIRSGTNWSQQQKITNPDDNHIGGDAFGMAVGIDGNTAIIGAWQDAVSSSARSQGSAHIYVRSGTNWSRQQRLYDWNGNGIINGDGGDLFGYSVAISGNSVIIGPDKDDDNGSNSGTVQIWDRGANDNVWRRRALLVPSNIGANQRFGCAVDIDNGRIITFACDASGAYVVG